MAFAYLKFSIIFSVTKMIYNNVTFAVISLEPFSLLFLFIL